MTVNIVFFDTNTLYGEHHFLETPPWQTFINNYSKAGIQIVLSEVVLDEVVNMYRSAILAATSALAKPMEEITKLRLTDGITIAIDIDERCKAYEAMLRNRFSELGAVVLPYPAISHQAVARRSMNRRRPFDKKGHNGYRDTLIWLSIVEFLKTNPCTEFHFVTNNKTDFFDGDNLALHSDLLADLEAEACSVRTVTCYYFVGDFNFEKLMPVLEHLTQIGDELAAGNYIPLNLVNFVVSDLVDLIQQGQQAYIAEDEYRSPQTMTAIHSAEIAGQVDVWQTTPTHLLISTSLKVIADVDLTHVPNGSVFESVSCNVTLEITFDTSSSQVQDVQVRGFTHKLRPSVTYDRYRADRQRALDETALQLTGYWAEQQLEQQRRLIDIAAGYSISRDLTEAMGLAEISQAQRDAIRRMTVGVDISSARDAASQARQEMQDALTQRINEITLADQRARDRLTTMASAMARGIEADAVAAHQRLAETALGLASGLTTPDLRSIRSEWDEVLAQMNASLNRNLQATQDILQQRVNEAARNVYDAAMGIVRQKEAPAYEAGSMAEESSSEEDVSAEETDSDTTSASTAND